MPTNSQIKETVRHRYARIAEDAAVCCEETASACCEPAETGDLGLGCGFPTSHANLAPGETVLDLGSGAGVDVFKAARAVGPEGRVIGVDMTPEMITRARANANRAGHENVEFRLGDIEFLPIPDHSIDVVLSNCVINLVSDKQRAFSEIHRVLRSGGRFVISDIVTVGDIPVDVREDLASWAGCVGGALDRDDYLDTIRVAGFVDLEVVAESSWQQPGGRGRTESVTVKGWKT